MNPDSPFKLGNWTVTPSLNQIQNRNTEIRLPRKQMDLLCRPQRGGDGMLIDIFENRAFLA